MNVPIPEWAHEATRLLFPEDGPVSRRWIAQFITNRWARETQVLRCAYCPQTYPPGTPATQHDLLTEHIKVCPKHPMRDVERDRDALWRLFKENPTASWAKVAALQEELASVRAQLPEGMEHCTILFKQCEKGHGWLTATNWVQHECQTCVRDRLVRMVKLLRRRANEAEGLSPTEDHHVAQLLHDIKHS